MPGVARRAKPGGERGIRTLVPSFPGSRLAGERYRPLSHLSVVFQIPGTMRIKYLKIYASVHGQKGKNMSFIFQVKVVPQSGRNKWVIDKSGTLKCFLKSAPEKGLANKELVKLIAKALSIPQQDVQIIAGQTSRTKRIKVSVEITLDKLLALLKIEKQQSLFE